MKDQVRTEATLAETFRESMLAQAKARAYLANRNLEYWETLKPLETIEAMKEDDELNARLKEAKDHERVRAQREKEARGHEEFLKMIAAFVAGATFAAFCVAIFLRG